MKKLNYKKPTIKVYPLLTLTDSILSVSDPYPGVGEEVPINPEE